MKVPTDFSRRSLLVGLPLLLAGCGVGPGGFFDGGNYGSFEDNGVLATFRELGIGLVAYSPLGRGFLSGAIRSLDDLAPKRCGWHCRT